MSVVEHHQVEAAKTLGVGDEVDGDDPPAGNRKAEDDTRPCAGSPHESRGSVHERRLCGAWDAWGSLYECKNLRDVFPRTASGRSCTSWVDIAKPNPNLRPSLTMRVTGLRGLPLSIGLVVLNCLPDECLQCSLIHFIMSKKSIALH